MKVTSLIGPLSCENTADVAEGRCWMVVSALGALMLTGISLRVKKFVAGYLAGAEGSAHVLDGFQDAVVAVDGVCAPTQGEDLPEVASMNERTKFQLCPELGTPSTATLRFTASSRADVVPL